MGQQAVLLDFIATFQVLSDNNFVKTTFLPSGMMRGGMMGGRGGPPPGMRGPPPGMMRGQGIA